MVTDEVQRNMGGVIASRKSRLKAREYACEQINKMFGLNISVEFEEDSGNDEGEPLDVEERIDIND